MVQVAAVDHSFLVFRKNSVPFGTDKLPNQGNAVYLTRFWPGKSLVGIVSDELHKAIIWRRRFAVLVEPWLAVVGGAALEIHGHRKWTILVFRRVVLTDMVLHEPSSDVAISACVDIQVLADVVVHCLDI